MKLFIGNISWKSTEEDLRKQFGRFGTIADLKLIEDKETGKSRGFGFISYEDRREGEIAIREMDGAELNGRQLRVSEAQERARR